jgi:hypothetical protein
MLSFGGRADLDTLLELEMEVSTNGNLVAASLWIDVQPGMDRRCFQALLDLPPHPDVRQVWLLNCYHSEDADLQMLLLGKSVAALTGYVMSWIRTAPGVIDTEISTVLDWRWLAGPDDIVELCELFFTRNARERRQAANAHAQQATGQENPEGTTSRSTLTSGQTGGQTAHESANPVNELTN